MAMKTITNCEYKLRSPSIPEIIFTNKPPKYLKHYQIGAKIGKGSYATVREAIDTNTNELVAIKICSKRKLARIPGGLRAVRKEARILSLLDHENTIKLIEKFSLPEKEKIYLIMQNVNCGNLEQLIQRNEGMGLPMKQIQSLFHDLLKGLLYLREKRIVHGDIKPENLLLSNEGRLVITDFGVSRVLRKKKSKKHLRETLSCDQLRFVRKHSNQSSRSDTLTSDRTSDESVQFSSNEEDDDFRSKMHEDNEENNDKDKNNGKNYGMNHTAQGTIAFEPPEVASGKKRYSKCGHELDLWAAGIVLYYLATGRYPFKGSSFMELILNISNGVFEDLPSDLDSDLVILIKSMLNADPKKRPSIDDLFSFPFVKKEFKSKKSCKVVENDSIFTRKKDGKYYFIEKKDQTDQCVIC